MYGASTSKAGRQVRSRGGCLSRGDGPEEVEEQWHMEGKEGGKSIWGQELCLNFVLFSSKRKYYFTL